MEVIHISKKKFDLYVEEGEFKVKSISNYKPKINKII